MATATVFAANIRADGPPAIADQSGPVARV